MIFNKDVLFAHVPKTGGMAISDVLLRVLAKPLYYSHPHPPNPSLAGRGIVEIPGNRHETLAQCRQVMARHGHDIARTGLILAGLRDPYAIEVSRFAYMQNGHAWDSGVNQEIAMEGDFETFARDSDDHGGGRVPVQDYFELDGIVPSSLRVLRQENLADELRAALAGVGIESGPELRCLNASRHGDVHGYYTREAEAAVFERYRWVFEKGYYPRLDPRTFPFSTRRRRFTDPLVLEGPVERLGLAGNCWGDTWVGGTVGFPARATAAVRGFRLNGATPDGHRDPTELRLRMGRREFAATFPAGQPFDWEIPCPLSRHEAMDIELRAAPTFCPRDVEPGSADRRSLAFRLFRFEFLPADAGALATPSP
jgi:hypothetical protein